MRVHRDEIIRFANSEEGTEVWVKSEVGIWAITVSPSWYEVYSYIVKDRYAELRKESLDTNRPIQVRNETGEWKTPPYDLAFTLPLENYRLKPKEDKFKYPICKRSKIYGYTIEFTGEQEGVIIADTEKSKGADYIIGLKSDDWVKHTNINTWEDCDYKEPTYYYKWEKLLSKDKILVSDLISDKYAEKSGYKEDGWVKRTNTKRTWDN